MTTSSSNIRAQLVLPQEAQSWILGKFVNRLAEYLPEWNVSVEVGDKPSEYADINHWGIYHLCKETKQTPGTFFITHVDSFIRINKIRTALKTADVGICMSSDTVNYLVQEGIPRERLCYITPGSDLEIKPRRIVIGLTTNIYRDKCKREDVLIDLARKRRLDSFNFKIFGKGWEDIVSILENAGGKVDLDTGTEDYLADYSRIKEAVPLFDYYLYMGLDEGSMGTLDALAAGIPTIVTPQGFHVDIQDGITYPFWETSDLMDVFDRIELERYKRIRSVQALTWREYAHQHALLWRALLVNPAGMADWQSVLKHRELSLSESKYYAPVSVRAKSRILFYLKPIYNYLLRVKGFVSNSVNRNR